MALHHHTKADGHSDAFLQWMREVDEVIASIAFLGLEDLPDFDYASAFAAGDAPADVAVDVLANADFPEELL